MALVGGGGKGITESIREIISAFFPQLLINQIVLWDMHVPLRSELCRFRVRSSVLYMLLLFGE